MTQLHDTDPLTLDVAHLLGTDLAYSFSSLFSLSWCLLCLSCSASLAFSSCISSFAPAAASGSRNCT